MFSKLGCFGKNDSFDFTPWYRDDYSLSDFEWPSELGQYKGKSPLTLNMSSAEFVGRTSSPEQGLVAAKNQPSSFPSYHESDFASSVDSFAAGPSNAVRKPRRKGNEFRRSKSTLSDPWYIARDNRDIMDNVSVGEIVMKDGRPMKMTHQWKRPVPSSVYYSAESEPFYSAESFSDTPVTPVVPRQKDSSIGSSWSAVTSDPDWRYIGSPRYGPWGGPKRVWDMGTSSYVSSPISDNWWWEPAWQAQSGSEGSSWRPFNSGSAVSW